jgi:ABC-type lipoprotein release transport system permease subunit
MIAKMAWRNLWRNRRRTIITLVSISFGLLISNTFTSIAAGTYSKLIDTAAQSGTGHVTLEPIGYRDDPGNDRVLTHATDLRQKTLENRNVTQASERVIGQIMAATADGSVGAGYLAVDPKEEGDGLFVLRYLKEGRGLQASTDKRVLIGSGMAKQLGLKLNQKIVITTTDKAGEIVSGLVRVEGIFRTGIMEADSYLMVLPIDYMRTLLGYAPDEATQVVVMIADQREAEQVAAQLTPLATPHNGVAQPWAVMMPEVASYIAMDSASNYVFQIFIFLLIGAGILNTVLMSVLERMKEFGVLIAIGMSPARLWAMIMSETFWLAIVGLIVGTINTIPAYAYLATYGLDLRSLMSEDLTVGGTLVDPVMYAGFYWDYALAIVGGVFALIMVAGIYPAFVASKADPVRTINTL